MRYPFLKRHQIFKFALPNYKNMPAETFQSRFGLFVAFYISFKFFLPVCRIGSRSRSSLTVRVAVPKTAIYKNSRMKFGQDDVWTAGKVFSMESETVTHSMKKRTHDFFRASIASLYPRHNQTPLFQSYLIHWEIRSLSFGNIRSTWPPTLMPCTEMHQASEFFVMQQGILSHKYMPFYWEKYAVMHGCMFKGSYLTLAVCPLPY